MKTFKKFLENKELNLPEYLYHATYKPYLDSIMKHGLGGYQQKKNYEDSESGKVYLALDPEVARAYAETSDEVPEDWLDNIVVLTIDTGKLDKELIGSDRNVQDNNGDTLEYKGIISPNAIIGSSI